MVVISVANQNFFHGISKRAKPYATMVEEMIVNTTFGNHILKGVQHIVAEMVFGAGLPAVDKTVPGGVGRPQPEVVKISWFGLNEAENIHASG
ncbi:Uncharacterised protein [Klebsiella pneumoniae]|nr:Uncharacterised protein [Klebsiella pneumoniae]